MSRCPSESLQKAQRPHDLLQLARQLSGPGLCEPVATAAPYLRRGQGPPSVRMLRLLQCTFGTLSQMETLKGEMKCDARPATYANVLLDRGMTSNERE